MEDREGKLVEAAVAGDNDALTTLLEGCAPQLRGRLATKIRSAWRSVLDVEDVLQVTYIEAFQKIATFTDRGEGAFLAWLTRVAENNLLDAVRALERAKRPPAEMRLQPNEDTSVSLYDRLMMTTTTPSRHAAAGEIREYVAEALRGLPADYARVIELYELQGHTAAEVAKELGRTEGAVYMLRARSLDRLRELLVGAVERFGGEA